MRSSLIPILFFQSSGLIRIHLAITGHWNMLVTGVSSSELPLKNCKEKRFFVKNNVKKITFFTFQFSLRYFREGWSGQRNESIRETSWHRVCLFPTQLEEKRLKIANLISVSFVFKCLQKIAPLRLSKAGNR